MKAEVKGDVITLEGTADEVAQALKLLGYAGATLAPKYVLPLEEWRLPIQWRTPLGNAGNYGSTRDFERLGG